MRSGRGGKVRGCGEKCGEVRRRKGSKARGDGGECRVRGVVWCARVMRCAECEG